MIYETQEQLEEALQFWQKTLRLADWNIKAEMKRHYDLPADINGRVIPHWESKDATIEILNALDFDSDCIAPQCHEKTLVHELLHLHTRPIVHCESQNEGQCREEELAINLITDALVRLKNG